MIRVYMVECEKKTVALLDSIFNDWRQGCLAMVGVGQEGQMEQQPMVRGEMRDRGEVGSVARPCVVMRLSHRHHRPRLQSSRQRPRREFDSIQVEQKDFSCFCLS
jgi:hypothetical protein